MKQITAVVRPSKVDAVKAALVAIDVLGMTINEVRGFGRQKGQVERYRGNAFTVEFLPKMRITTVVADDKVEATIEADARQLREILAAGGMPALQLAVGEKSRHSSGGVYLGNPNGIVLTTREGRTVYHMGDTDVFAGMSLIAEMFKPDIGIVPIGDRFTMGARSAAFACKKFFSFKTILPCHYGTFPGMLDADASKFVAEMQGHNVIAPKIGEAVTV